MDYYSKWLSNCTTRRQFQFGLIGMRHNYLWFLEQLQAYWQLRDYEVRHALFYGTKWNLFQEV